MLSGFSLNLATEAHHKPAPGSSGAARVGDPSTAHLPRVGCRRESAAV